MNRLAAAAFFAGIALFMLVGYFKSQLSGMPAMLALLLSVGLPSVCCIWLLQSHFRNAQKAVNQREQLRRESIQAEIIRLAALQGGKFSIPEIVAKTAISNERIKEAAEALHLQDMLEVQIAPSGALVYALRNHTSSNDKHLAQGALDA